MSSIQTDIVITADNLLNELITYKNFVSSSSFDMTVFLIINNPSKKHIKEKDTAMKLNNCPELQQLHVPPIFQINIEGRCFDLIELLTYLRRDIVNIAMYGFNSFYEKPHQHINAATNKPFSNENLKFIKATAQARIDLLKLLHSKARRVSLP